MPRAREPRVLDLEKSLGFKWSQGLYRAKDIVDLPILDALLASIEELKHNFVLLTPSKLRSSADLRARSNELFERFGPDLWPPSSIDRSQWLNVVGADPSAQTEFYRSDLYYLDSQNKETLRGLFYELVLQKCIRYYGNQKQSKLTKKRDGFSPDHYDNSDRDLSKYSDTDSPSDSNSSDTDSDEDWTVSVVPDNVDTDPNAEPRPEQPRIDQPIEDMVAPVARMTSEHTPRQSSAQHIGATDPEYVDNMHVTLERPKSYQHSTPYVPTFQADVHLSGYRNTHKRFNSDVASNGDSFAGHVEGNGRKHGRSSCSESTGGSSQKVPKVDASHKPNARLLVSLKLTPAKLATVVSPSDTGNEGSGGIGNTEPSMGSLHVADIHIPGIEQMQSIDPKEARSARNQPTGQRTTQDATPIETPFAYNAFPSWAPGQRETPSASQSILEKISTLINTSPSPRASTKEGNVYSNNLKPSEPIDTTAEPSGLELAPASSTGEFGKAPSVGLETVFEFSKARSLPMKIETIDSPTMLHTLPSTLVTSSEFRSASIHCDEELSGGFKDGANQNFPTASSDYPIPVSTQQVVFNPGTALPFGTYPTQITSTNVVNTTASNDPGEPGVVAFTDSVTAPGNAATPDIAATPETSTAGGVDRLGAGPAATQSNAPTLSATRMLWIQVLTVEEDQEVYVDAKLNTSLDSLFAKVHSAMEGLIEKKDIFRLTMRIPDHPRFGQKYFQVKSDLPLTWKMVLRRTEEVDSDAVNVEAKVWRPEGK